MTGTMFMVGGQQMTPAEYQIKGAFLFNFAQFTEWPPSAFPEANTPFVVGILGENPFGIFLEELLKHEQIRGRRLELQYFERAEEINNVHLLFIHKTHPISPDELATLCTEKKALTVGDAPDFTARGGIIRLYEADQKVRFEINLKAAADANLVFSSKVLRLATICCESDN